MSSRDSVWIEGVRLCRSSAKGEHIVGASAGVKKSHAARAMREEERQHAQCHIAIVWSPWHQHESGEGPAQATGWVATEGCAPCGDNLGLVRRPALASSAEVRMEAAVTVVASLALAGARGA